jgi:hypothetical protein
VPEEIKSPTNTVPVSTPLQAINAALDQIIFAFFVTDAVAGGRIQLRDSIEVRAGDQGMEIKAKLLESDIVQGTSNLRLSALAMAVIVADEAMCAHGSRDPNDTTELGSARNILYMIRCAFAHGPFSPQWECKGPFQRTYSVPSIGITFNGSACHGKPYSLEDHGGLKGFYTLLQWCRDELKKRTLPATTP